MYIIILYTFLYGNGAESTAAVTESRRRRQVARTISRRYDDG